MSLFGLFDSDSTTSSTNTTLSNGLQGSNDNIVANVGSAPGGVTIVSTDHNAVSQAEDILNASLVYSDDQIHNAIDTVAAANQSLATGAANALSLADSTIDNTYSFAAGVINNNTQALTANTDDILSFSAGTIKNNTNLIAAAGNAVLTFANDQTDKTVSAVTGAANAALVFANDQTDKTVSAVTGAANAALVFANDQTDKTVSAVTGAANAALVFADDQAQRYYDSFGTLIDANNSANSNALSTIQNFADQAFTFAGQGVSKTLDTITAANTQEHDFVMSAIEQGNAASAHALDLVTGNAQAVFDTVTNFSAQTLSEISQEANANLQAVTAGQRSDAANSLDQVVKVAGVAFVALAIAAVAIPFMMRKAA